MSCSSSRWCLSEVRQRQALAGEWLALGWKGEEEGSARQFELERHGGPDDAGHAVLGVGLEARDAHGGERCLVEPGEARGARKLHLAGPAVGADLDLHQHFALLALAARGA